VTVARVVPGSPAARAGIQPGDVILRSRSRVLRSGFDWEAELLDMRVGEAVPLRIRRGNREFDVSVTVADLPWASAPKVAVMRELELVSLTPAIRAERGIQSARGALVLRASDRVIDEIGLQPGDVVVQVNRTPVETADQAAQAIDYASRRGAIRVFFERGGRIFSTDFMIQ
jgi:serine protease Do